MYSGGSIKSIKVGNSISTSRLDVVAHLTSQLLRRHEQEDENSD
jgi:hypothetical protein